MRGIHRGPVNSPHKWPVTRKMFPFDDVIVDWTTRNTFHRNLMRIIRVLDRFIARSLWNHYVYRDYCWMMRHGKVDICAIVKLYIKALFFCCIKWCILFCLAVILILSQTNKMKKEKKTLANLRCHTFEISWSCGRFNMRSDVLSYLT